MKNPPNGHYLEGLARLVATGAYSLQHLYAAQWPQFLFLPRFQRATPEQCQCKIGRSFGCVCRTRAHLANEERQKSSHCDLSQSISAAHVSTALPMLGSGAVFEDVSLEDLLVPLRVSGKDIVHSTMGTT